MLEIDGSMGEGGGQVLRTSLALSILTHTPIIVTNIRAGRKEAGLKPQHLKSIDAAAAISRAGVEGALPGSRTIRFEPGEVRNGRYRFDIGTAGATALVLQTVYLPLALAQGASSLQISGGTHVPQAPTFDYLEMHWRAALHSLGFDLRLELEKAGFYPAGGGRIQAAIRPLTAMQPFVHTAPGALARISGVSLVANLDLEIASRQKRQALKRLQGACPEIKIRTAAMPSDHKGTTLLLRAEFHAGDGAIHPGGCFTSLGKLGKPAEQVADEAADAMLAFLDSRAAVDAHLADQLLLPLSFASGVSRFTTSRVSRHLLTCADLIQMFFPVRIAMSGALDTPGEVTIIPPAAAP